MDLDSLTHPKFAAGHENAAFLTSSGVLHQAWKEICSISANNVDTSVVNEYGSIVYVTFRSLDGEDFNVGDDRYGECNIQNDNTVFSANLKGDDGKSALVYKGALNRFLHTLQSSNLEARMQKFGNQKQEQAILFVGHSMGGAVATLATLWFLGKRLRNIFPFCITFGSPLVGDASLGEAIGREDWSGKFCHVVSQYDIVPRMLLAPFESISEPLNVIVPHWGSITGIDSIAASNLSIEEACTRLCDSVMKFTSTIAKNYPGKSLLRSPFRPFGSYIFCSTQGAACIEDPEVVLKMLHFTMQSTEEKSVDKLAGSCISYHTGYGQMLENITECLFNELNIANPISNSSFEMGIAMQMEAIGVGAQNEHALLALRKAGEVKNKQDMNTAELNYNLSENQSNMAELEWYKLCRKASGYYDSFKDHNDKKDFHADACRIKLGNFWDEIVKMVENHELPSDFQCQNKWINAGNTYRKLVEPLDIAHHYKHKGDGSYLSPGVRPHRHAILEKWMKDKEQTRIGRTKKPRTKFSSLTEDSCFWAHLEEACKTLASLQQEQEQFQVINSDLKGNLEKFEDYVVGMIKLRSISAEVFLEGSSFMKWWHQYRQLQLQSPSWRSDSPLFNFMEGESWKSEI